MTMWDWTDASLQLHNFPATCRDLTTFRAVSQEIPLNFRSNEISFMGDKGIFKPLQHERPKMFSMFWVWQNYSIDFEKTERKFVI